ncbi:hypothetical protein LS73_005795 [Helicobacter muridarum]|uniref:Uncharacterized protein n=1 Tax=Helicobacter muridarum TaxID=216 RepID=A0A099U0B3_9HELI|nr:hypothetical protein [Helicobacter muridarum]TLE00042.1 hypothetical protein LS73_005795 [Helicobacter muridarum]STQ86111.1 Uncharacterised protein [Helicobacter muridarum]
MKSFDDILNTIIKSLQAKQEEDGNKTPSLNNIYDAILETFPKIKNKSEKSREIIVKRIKIAREYNKKLLQDDIKELIYFILSDIAKLPDK